MVTISDPGQRRFGFSMVARDTDNNMTNVGTWSAGSADTQAYGPGNFHVGHRNAPFVNDSHTFEVNWAAPASAVGEVTFYVAANAANGSGSPDSGDHIYLHNLTISEAVAMNLPPEITVPGGTFNATSGLAVPVAGISFADPDAGDGAVTVDLSVQNGSLTVADSVAGGVGPGGISGNGSASVTVEGTLAQLNATFGDPSGLVYQSSPFYAGPETLELTANDNGNTGPGGDLIANAQVEISVNPPPALSDFQFADADNLQFTLTGVAGLSYTVEFSANLDDWEFLGQVTLVSDTILVTDDTVSGVPARFYRVSEGGP